MSPKELIGITLKNREKDMHPDEAASVLSIFVKASGRADHAGFFDVQTFVESKVPFMSCRGLATSLLSLSKLGADNVKLSLVDAVTHSSLIKVENFNNQELSNAIYGLTKMDRGTMDDPLIAALCNAVASEPRIGNFIPQEISTILGALKNRPRKEFDVRIVEALCGQALKNSMYFNPVDIIVTLSALSKLDYYDGELVAALCGVASSSSRSFKGPELAATLYALAKFGHHDGVLLQAFCAEMLRSARGFNVHEATNALSALCILHRFDEDLFAALFRALNFQLQSTWGGVKTDKLSFEALTQLHAVITSVRVFQGSEKLAELKISQDLISRAVEASVSALKQSQTSPMHLEVSQTLDKFDIKHENKIIVGGCHVSIRIPSSPVFAKDVIIEIDGPLHFLRGKGGKPLAGVDRLAKVKGYIELKDALLQSQGYTVVHVPYFLWPLGQHNKTDKKQAYFMRLLGQHMTPKAKASMESQLGGGRGGATPPTTTTTTTTTKKKNHRRRLPMGEVN